MAREREVMAKWGAALLAANGLYFLSIGQASMGALFLVIAAVLFGMRATPRTP